MAVFVVLSDMPNPKLFEKIKQEYPNDHLILNDRSWLVAADVISRKVSSILDITSEDPDALTGQMGTAIVFAIDGFYGFHNKETWEWIGLKS